MQIQEPTAKYEITHISRLGVLQVLTYLSARAVVFSGKLKQGS